ncbi:MAG: hypothetical protein IPH45_15175 [Bacteroidales bacterium]|nr:hypothetical protein [Bacteroidales bacterium]
MVIIIAVLRAWFVPMSHDEAATFFNYVQRFHLSPFQAIPDANNHILNTYITYFLFKLFGSTAIALRLSNLIFLPFYLFFCYKLSKELSSIFLRWIFLLAMVGTFHYMEFFAITRGYGISLTFLMGALWQVFQAGKTGKFRHFHIANLFMLLSCLSILIELYNFALLLGWMLIYAFFHAKGQRIRKVLPVLLSGLIPILLVTAYTLYLQKNGAYIERGPTGLWDASLKTLFSFITDLNPWDVQKMMLLLTAITVLPLLVLGGVAAFKRLWKPDTFLLFPYLLFGNLVIIMIVVRFFFSDYPESRLVLFLFPITIGSIIYSLDLLIRLTKVKALFIIATPLLFFPFHSINAFNLEYITWYKKCHIPRSFYGEIMKDWKEGAYPPVVSGYGTQAWSWQYLVREHGGVANEMCTLNFPSHPTEYKILALSYYSNWREDYDTIGFDPVSQLHLLKRKESLRKQKITEVNYDGITGKTNSESMLIYEKDFGFLRDKQIQCDIDFSFESYNTLLYGAIVFAGYDSANSTFFYDEIHLNWIRDTWDGEKHKLVKSWLMPQLPANASYLKVFFWNKGKSEYAIKKGRIIFSELESDSIQE